MSQEFNYHADDIVYFYFNLLAFRLKQVKQFSENSVMSILPVQQVLKFGRVVAAIDDEALVLVVELSLRAQFTSEVLGWIWNIIHNQNEHLGSGSR